MSRLFHVILSPQPDGGFFVECPALPGCYTEGDTRDEALANIREAIVPALEDLVELGQAIPETSPPRIAEVSVLPKSRSTHAPLSRREVIDGRF